MNPAFQPTGAAAIGGAAGVLLLAALSPIEVQLFIATCGALLAIWTVRQRALAASLPKQATLRRFFAADIVRLSAIGEAMWKKARRHRRPLSMVVFDFADLPELQEVFDGRVAGSVGALIARRLQLIARLRGVVVRTGPTTFVVLLPNFDGARTRRAILRAMGRACCIEFDVGDSEIVLVAEYTTAVVRSDALSIAHVYRGLSTALTEQRRHTERHRVYLKRERESHTRPMRLAPIG